jgi:hypothetical protein
LLFCAVLAAVISISVQQALALDSKSTLLIGRHQSTRWTDVINSGHNPLCHDNVHHAKPACASLARILAIVTAMQEITDWLTKLGLPEYAGAFAENGIDVPVSAHLSDQDDLHCRSARRAAGRRERPHRLYHGHQSEISMRMFVPPAAAILTHESGERLPFISKRTPRALAVVASLTKLSGESPEILKFAPAFKI